MKIVKILLILMILSLLFFGSKAISSKYSTLEKPTDISDTTFQPESGQPIAEVIEKPKVTHLKTPAEVRGIYVTAYSFLYPPFKAILDNLIDTTTINTIVVDIKDAPGTIDYDIGLDLPCVQAKISNEDLRAKIDYYHEKKIYVIARIAVMRDACFVKNNPELAAMKKDGKAWRDKGGHYWISPHELENAQYIVDISKAVYESGFDEIQLDYVRYPSDGQMNLLKYEYSDNVITSSTDEQKRRGTMKNFVEYVREGLGDIPLSADLFGLVLPANDDLGIGQHIDDFVPLVDYISPMIYPSHFHKNWNNLKNTHTMPYETIYQSTKIGLDRISAKFGTSTAMSTMRPWLQDFSIFGVVYNASEVKAQIKALDDLGVKSYILWNASNRYTKGVIEK